MDNAIEKKIKMYTNLNTEIDQRTNNNRFLLLLQDEFHGDLIASSLDDNRKLIKQSMMNKTFVQNLLSGVSYTRMVIAGNFKQQDATDLAQ